MPLTPLGRWTIPPHQRVNAGGTFKMGVFAASKAGIEKVTFTITGQGYGGTSSVDVTAWTLFTPLGESSAFYAYWISIDCDDFTSDGVVTIEAVITGDDAGTRDKTTNGGGHGLDSYSLIVNPLGSYSTLKAWVHTAVDDPVGNDATGAVGDPESPFLTPGNAATALHTAGSGDAGGAEILLGVGTHGMTYTNSPGVIACADQWLTMKPEAGQSKATVALGFHATQWFCDVRKFKVQDVALTFRRFVPTSGERAACEFWMHDCTHSGGGPSVENTTVCHPGYGAIYLTNSSITDCDFPTMNGNTTKIARGLAIGDIGNDAFQNVPFVYNCTVDSIDSDSDATHADTFGDGGTSNHNIIFCNVKSPDCRFQLMWLNLNAATPVEGYAFINCLMHQSIRDWPGRFGAGFYFAVNHLIMWHCDFLSSTGTPYDGNLLFHDDGRDTVMADLSMVGNLFESVQESSPVFDLTLDKADASWRANHFERVATGNYINPGTDVSTGSYTLDENFKPIASGPLDNRVTRVVPFDADNNARPATCAVGALEPVAAEEGGTPVIAHHLSRQRRNE